MSETYDRFNSPPSSPPRRNPPGGVGVCGTCPSPSPCPDARRPRSATAATRSRPMSPPRASSRRSRRPPTLRACGAPAGCIRARPHPLPPVWDRVDSGPLAAFSSLHSSGRPDGLSLLAPVGETHPEAQSRRDRETSATLRFRGVSYCPFSARGRRGGFAAHGAVATGLYCGPRYAAIWRSQATAISRRLAALATRPSATAPRRLRLPGGGFKLGDVKFEIRNSKFEIPRTLLVVGGRCSVYPYSAGGVRHAYRRRPA